MPRLGSGRDVGDKLGPKLVDLVVAGTLAARKGLAPHEAKVAAAGLQQVIDRAGHEVADLYAPLVGPYLASDQAHPAVSDYLARAASGTHQWQALAAFGVGASGAPNALANIFGNELAPVVYDIVETNPHLIPDIGTIASLAARQIIDTGEAEHSGRQLGYTQGWTDRLTQMSRPWPGLSQIIELLNRGDIGLQQAYRWMHLSGWDPAAVGSLVSLQRAYLSPSDAALGVLRGTIDLDYGHQVGRAAGLLESDFDTLVANTGEPPGLMQLLEAYRRGFIDDQTLDRGIRQSRVRNEWIPVVTALRYAPIPTADAIDAYQRGKLSEANAVVIATQNGVEPDQVPILIANAGNPPSPEQLLSLWRRGLIDQATVDRGLLEGRTRDEWIPQVRELRYSPISTADAIDAWLRGHLDQQQAETIAAQNGSLPSQVPALLANAGNPLALEQLLEAYRRKIIDEDTLKKGIREGRLRDDWTAAAVALRYAPMSTADAVDAALQGQLSVDAAADRAAMNGLEPGDFTPLYQSAGDPLARTELQQLFNRGAITMAEYKQGLRESRLKDKYIDQATLLRTRLPAPNLVVESLAAGLITADQATALLAEDGYSTTVQAMIVGLGETRATGPHKELAVGQVQQLYGDRIIDHGTAVGLLEQLHYTAANAQVILSLADYKTQQRIFDTAIAAVRAQYLTWRADDLDARADLLALNLPVATADLYLQVWDMERQMHPKQLSEAQLVKAAKNNLLVKQGTLSAADWATANQEAGHERLVHLGYSPDDADALLAGA